MYLVLSEIGMGATFSLITAVCGIVAALINRKKIVEIRHVVGLAAGDPERQKRVTKASKEFTVNTIWFFIFFLSYYIALGFYIKAGSPGSGQGGPHYLILYFSRVAVVVLAPVFACSVVILGARLSVYRRQLKPLLIGCGVVAFSVAHLWWVGPELLSDVGIIPEKAERRNAAAWDIARQPGLDQRSYDRAVELAQEADELEPLNAAFLNTLGASLYRAGDYESALEKLNQSESLAPGVYIENDAFLAMTHWKLGNKEKFNNSKQSLVISLYFTGLINSESEHSQEIEGFYREITNLELDEIRPNIPVPSN